MGRTKTPTWNSLKALALGLDLPGVEETTSWGQPCLKAHKKLWVWWSPHEDAPVFKVPFEEREMLIEVDPDTYFFTNHYKNHTLILVRPDRLDLDWARANLIRVWRAQAPKKLLKAYDADMGMPGPAAQSKRCADGSGSGSDSGAAPGAGAGLPAGLTGPAVQALNDAGINSLEAVAAEGRASIARLRGIGPSAMKSLETALAAHGLTFAEPPAS